MMEELPMLNGRRANLAVFKDVLFLCLPKARAVQTVRVPRGCAADYVLGTTSATSACTPY